MPGEDIALDVPVPSTRRRFYTPTEVGLHNAAEDCWVSFFGHVYDLTELVKEHKGPLAQPIIEFAGQDITHWFDAETKDPKTHIDPLTCIEVPYLPFGRFVHVGPNEPTTDWATDFGTPWWRDAAKYGIGALTAKTRTIRIVNVLTQQEQLLEVCSEETIDEIQERYNDYNKHAASYTWKTLEDGAFRPLDMKKSLAKNGVADDTAEFERLSIDDDFYIPVVHLYYNDDLTHL